MLATYLAIDVIPQATGGTPTPAPTPSVCRASPYASSARVGLASVFANLASGFSRLIDSPFIDATAWWPGTPVRDDGGSIITPGTPVSVDCRAQFDVPTLAMRQAEGFMENDARVIVLSFDAVLDTDASIRVASGINAGSWSLITVTRDPAGIGYECRARRI